MHAVLISGGLDSAILLGELLRRGQRVHPLYVRCGLAWETTELLYLDRFLHSLACPPLQPLTCLELPVADLYGDHWSFTGSQVPDDNSPDDAVFLPGRNLLLCGKAMLWCHLHGVETLSLGSLGTNPFPDATPAYFDDLQNIINRSVAGKVRLERPFANLTKKAVMQLGSFLPLEHTFSCIHPERELHCGRCNKCAERKAAFTCIDFTDPTHYAETTHPTHARA